MNPPGKSYEVAQILAAAYREQFDPLEDAANSFLHDREETRREVSEAISVGNKILWDQEKELKERLREACEKTDAWKKACVLRDKLEEVLKELAFVDHKDAVGASVYISWDDGGKINDIEDINVSVNMGRYHKKFPIESTPAVEAALAELAVCQGKRHALRDARQRFENLADQNWNHLREIFRQHVTELALMDGVAVYEELLRRRLRDESIEPQEVAMPPEASAILAELEVEPEDTKKEQEDE